MTARRGQTLIEFALVALAFYLLLAGVLTFGYLFYAAFTAQQAADVAAREISRTPLPADDLTLEEVLRGDANADPRLVGVRTRIYDPHYLVLNLDTLHGRATLAELIAELPLLNRQLSNLMISDEIGGVRVLRYPGSVFNDVNSADDPADPPPSGFLVAIPLVVSRAGDGVETIDWIPVVEEIDSAEEPEPFQLAHPQGRQRGIVALRVNYPFQAAAMSGFRANPAGPFEPNGANPIAADDGAVFVVDQDGFTPAGTPAQSDDSFGAYAGSFGLGSQAALGSQELTGGRPVRPFRKLISAQAIYRREIIE